jgi:serine/threonine-protein kinase
MTSQPDPGQALSVGVVVADTYQVTSLLGRGGMGSVWEASHLRLPGKRVAIKVLHADIAADQEALARFRREAEIATRLGHPNIVEVHDFNALPGGQPYLVLELLVGESLESRMRRAPVSLDNAMRIAGQIGAALAAAHRQGVVHRDLKPQNVFLVRPRDDEGDGAGEIVKVLDFGISKIRGSQTVKTLDSAILGTPQYMAPEQATGNHAAVDARTDVFALGAIAYEMLAGRPAFSGQSIPEVVYKVVYEQPAPLAELVPTLPARVVDAIGRALAKQQAERFPDVVSFVEQMAGVSLSTLRRAPITLPRPAALPGGMDSTVAAGLAPPTPRTGPAARVPDRGADALAHTVDSGRRELAPIAPPAGPHAAPPAGGAGPFAAPPAGGAGPFAAPPAGGAGPFAAPPAGLAGAPGDTEMARPRRARAWLVAAALLLLAGGGAAAALLARSSTGSTPRSADAPPAPSAAPAPAAPAPPTRGSPARGSSPDPSRPAVAAADRPGAGAGTDDTAAPGSPRFSQLRPEPPARRQRAAADRRARAGETRAGETGDGDGGDAVLESRADLRAAILDGEQALRAGDYRQALVMAERALRHGAGQAAHALRARASCGIGDLGNARASFLRLGRRHQFLRRRVVAFCARLGVELAP